MSSSRLSQAVSDKNDPQQNSAKPFDVRYLNALPKALQAKIFDYLYPWSKGLTAPLIEAEQPEEDKFEDKDPIPEYSFYQDKRSFFGNISAQMVATRAAEYVVMDEPGKVVELIKKFPSIIYEQIEIVDEEGRRMRGDILTIAAMMDAFNPFEIPVGKDYGAFEKIASHCPPQHVESVGNFVNSPEWDEATNRRMQPIRIAFKRFMGSVISVQVTAQATFTEVMAELAPAIEEFKQDLKSNPSEVITAGKAFDLQVISDAFQHLIERKNSLGGLFTKKSNAFCVVVGGSLQDHASKFDKRFVKNGLAYIIGSNELPDRSTCGVDTKSFSIPNLGSCLGFSFLYGLYGAVGTHVGAILVKLAEGISIFMSNKNSSKKKLMLRQGQTIESAVHDNVNCANNS